MLPRLPVGERFRDRLRRRGCTQAVLAGLCGITTDYLSQIERGLKTPSGDVLAWCLRPAHHRQGGCQTSGSVSHSVVTLCGKGSLISM
ncbi:helix-turn-helix domain-containing protein [Streptomyces microflavus]|uniref:Helix-turn-helix transcriptional regulator n=1 Tax=Streptomyces microflavus TaxID=1919 RepID=A0A7H8N084_STRMI|nr:helix-turn-helix transcriptional regulator [Streptomyces microflavus]QKW47743.1 helix-turn-helix transcriptional regulator [Streptomyces microflavus]